jgi:metal-responsive CopG/Arc/MetJ family transcriptional regulator
VPAKTEKVFLSLPPELWAQVAEVGRALGVENRPELIRILVRQAIAAVPWDGNQLQVASEGLNTVKHWAFNKLREKLGEIEQELNESRG